MEESSEFDYLRAIARKFGEMYVVEDLLSFVEHISDEQLHELGAAYELIDGKNHAGPISRWHSRVLFHTPMPRFRDRRFAQDLGGLFNVFAYLAKANIAPFSSNRVRYIEVVKEPNCATVPHELEYLIPVAAKYGVHYSESAMFDFLDAATDEDMDLLARTSERMRLNGHFAVVNDWINRFPIDKHQEAWLVCCLMGLLDHAGLSE